MSQRLKEWALEVCPPSDNDEATFPPEYHEDTENLDWWNSIDWENPF